MNIQRPITLLTIVLMALPIIPQQPRQQPGPHRPTPLPATACVSAITRGEVSSGKVFTQPIGGGLSILLDPTHSGWILRVLPTSAPRPQHDFAELATPPYQSINPLLITTDFNFRAQDLVGWNTRKFQFFARHTQAAIAQHAYDDYIAHPNDMQSINKLAALPQSAAVGELTILDARLQPGTANQSPTAAMFALHFQTTPHTLLQAQPSPLGHVDWLRFQLSLLLPQGFAVAPGWQVNRARCPH